MATPPPSPPSLCSMVDTLLGLEWIRPTPPWCHRQPMPRDPLHTVPLLPSISSQCPWGPSQAMVHPRMGAQWGASSQTWGRVAQGAHSTPRATKDLLQPLVQGTHHTSHHIAKILYTLMTKSSEHNIKRFYPLIRMWNLKRFLIEPHQ